jgi:hypothetical protein
MALDAITSVVPPEMVASLAAKDTALEAWNAVKERRIGSDQVQKTEAQRLLREFENMRFNSGEGVDDYTLRLQNVVAALETVGESIPPRRVVEKLLRTVPKSLRQVAVAIQVLANLSTLTLEDASGRLRVAQEAEAEDDAPPPRSDGKLYLTREQWEAQAEKEKCRSSDAGGSGSKSGDRRGKARRGQGGGDARTAPEKKLAINQCRRCLRTGHWACECPTKPKKAEAHVAQADEDEGPTLFFASARVNTRPVAHTSAVDLVEAKVFAQLDGDDGGVHDAGLWYLDTGATNHMKGAREAFSKLNTNIRAP